MSERLLKGDTVIVTAGKDKGKKGTINKIDRELGRVVVSGVNLVKRHTKPSPRNQQGGIIEREQHISASNVMLIDPKSGAATRIRFKTDEKGKKIRVAVKSGEEIPAPARTARK